MHNFTNKYELSIESSLEEIYEAFDAEITDFSYESDVEDLYIFTGLDKE